MLQLLAAFLFVRYFFNPPLSVSIVCDIMQYTASHSLHPANTNTNTIPVHFQSDGPPNPSTHGYAHTTCSPFSMRVEMYKSNVHPAMDRYSSPADRSTQVGSRFLVAEISKRRDPATRCDEKKHGVVEQGRGRMRGDGEVQRKKQVRVEWCLCNDEWGWAMYGLLKRV